MDRSNLDAELSNLIRETTEWKTTKRDRTSDNSLLERDACLTALANAITNYVTVELSRRLTVPSEPTPPCFSVSNSSDGEQPTSLKGAVPRPTMLSTTKVTPSSQRRSGSLPRMNKISQPSTPLDKESPLKNGSRYRSENRLDRFSPSPRPNETPLENKASRLRRLSTERRSLKK